MPFDTHCPHRRLIIRWLMAKIKTMTRTKRTARTSITVTPEESSKPTLNM